MALDFPAYFGEFPGLSLWDNSSTSPSSVSLQKVPSVIHGQSIFKIPLVMEFGKDLKNYLNMLIH